jgi:hypothetical protein
MIWTVISQLCPADKFRKKSADEIHLIFCGIATQGKTNQ